jgi:hypothetical protein
VSISIVIAFIRAVMKRSKSGLMVRSCFETAYHGGFVRHAAAVVRAFPRIAQARHSSKSLRAGGYRNRKFATIHDFANFNPRLMVGMAQPISVCVDS